MRMQVLGLCRFFPPAQGGLHIMGNRSDHNRAHGVSHVCHIQPRRKAPAQRLLTAGVVRRPLDDIAGVDCMRTARCPIGKHHAATDEADRPVRGAMGHRYTPHLNSATELRFAPSGRPRHPSQDADSGDPPAG